MYVSVWLNADVLSANVYDARAFNAAQYIRKLYKRLLDLQGQASHRCCVVLCEQLSTINNRVSYHKSL